MTTMSDHSDMIACADVQASPTCSYRDGRDRIVVPWVCIMKYDNDIRSNNFLELEVLASIFKAS